MNKKFAVRGSDLLLCIIFTEFMFQNPLMNRISMFRYTDEIVTMLCVAYIGLRILRHAHIPKAYGTMGLLMVLLVAVGLISNGTSGVNRTYVMIVLDMLYIFKIFICFIGASLYFQKRRHDKRLVDLIAQEVRLIIFVAFICLLISQFANIGMTYGVRYGIKCFRFIYTSPGMFSQYCIIFLFILTADLNNHRMTWKRGIYLFLLITIWISSGRTRGIVIIVIWLFLLLISKNIDSIKQFDVKQTVKKLLKPQYVAFVIVIALLLGWNQFQLYFGAEADTARNLLFNGGIAIMLDFFPFGSGFGTFGTEAAASNYSPLYYTYGLNSHWALIEGGSELTDCYWPAICAELGVIGLLLMGFLIFIFLKQFIKQSNGKKYCITASLTYMIYLLIASTASGAFVAYFTAEFVIICVAILSCQDIDSRRL